MRNFSRIRHLCVFFVLVSVAVSAQTTIHVPGDQATIQQAINAAANGDTVLVAPGTYNENINFFGKAITVKSSDGAAVTTIVGTGSGSVVRFTTAEGPESVIDGFTVRGGGAFTGGGVFVLNSSPTIVNNVITNNFARTGGGIGVRSGSPLIQGNKVTGNSQINSGGTGAGIDINGDSHSIIIGNTIARNQFPNDADGGGISLDGAGGVLISGNFITANSVSKRGGGIAVFNLSAAVIVNNVITDNSANDHTGDGVYVAASGPGPVFINNTVINSTNFSTSNALIENNIIFASGSQAALTCGTFEAPTLIDNILFSSDGAPNGGLCANVVGTAGNVAADPVFVNPARGNYHFAAGSPAWNSGDSTAPGLPATDFEGNARIQGAAIDHGAFEEGNPPVLAQLSISPADFTFADQPVSTEGPLQEFILTNIGTVATESMEIPAVPEFPQSNNCPPSLPVGSSCSVFMKFSPVAAGARTGVLTIFGNFGANYPKAELKGTGRGPGKQIQTISFAPLPDRTIGDAAFPVGATASSGLSVSFAAAGSCTVAGDIGTITAPGSCSITASQPGNDTFEAAAPVTQTFSIHKISQVINWAAPEGFAYGASLTLSATATSGLAVTYSAAGNCTVSGNTLTATAPGICSVTASQAGDDRYEPAPVQTRNISVSKGQQIITWPAPAAIIYGAALGSAQLNASVTVPGSAPAGILTYMPAPNTILGPGAGQVLTVTAAETDYYAAVTATVHIDVLYQSTGLCNWELGHSILSKINADGSSVFRVGKSVTARFRVCDVNRNSVGLPGTVRDFRLVQIVQGGVAYAVNAPVASSNGFTAFRWEPSSRQWLFNISTTNLSANASYYYQISLQDGSSIYFSFSLRDRNPEDDGQQEGDN